MSIKQPTDAQVENAKKRLLLTMSQVFDSMRKFTIRYNQLRQYLIEKGPEIGDGIPESTVKTKIKDFFKSTPGASLLAKELNKGSSFLSEESDKQFKDRLEIAYKNYLDSNVIKNKSKLSQYMLRFARNFEDFATSIKSDATTPQQKAQIYNFARILAKPSLDEPNTDFEDLPAVENKIGRYRPKDILTLIKVLEAYNKELKKHYMIFYKIKPTTPDIPTTDIIPESNKMSEDVKKLIEEELKVLNGKKMVRN
jgi:hypothetical protein